MTNRIMALDIGDARIGVAISDPVNITAQPHSSVDKRARRSIQNIISIVREQGVGTIVVGLPLELSGEKGEQAQKVLDFMSQFQSALDRRPELRHVKIEFWDERFTTAEAKGYVTNSKLRDKEYSAALDRVSAALILQGYLGQFSNGLTF